MTNKTEMVSVPLYATEEMKRAGMGRMAQAQRDGSASLYAYAAVCWEAMLECYQESAAPAEDVRAVVDELEGKLAIRNITIEQLTRKVEELEEQVTDLRGKARG